MPERRRWRERLGNLARRPGLRAAVAGRFRHAPLENGQADPGEIVWTWVPYEDDPAQGKDRPVLVLGVEGGRLLALMLTSKDHDRDEEQETLAGRHWMDVGSGGWDRQGRPSEVRLDRLLVLDPAEVRREGAAMDRAVFDRVVAAARRTQGW